MPDALRAPKCTFSGLNRQSDKWVPFHTKIGVMYSKGREGACPVAKQWIMVSLVEMAGGIMTEVLPDLLLLLPFE